MTKSIRFLLAPLAVLTLVGLGFSQYRDMGQDAYFGGGFALPNTDSEGGIPGLTMRAAYAWPLADPLQLEAGITGVDLRADQYRATLLPLDARLRFAPVHSEKIIPFIFGGIGMLYHETNTRPDSSDLDAENSGWSAFAPLGVGLQYRLDEQWSLDLHGGYNLSFSEEIDPLKVDGSDNWTSALIGLRFSAGSGDRDDDHDGLTNREEKQLGTDPKNPDTDGDGLRDGDEVLTHKTDPLNKDTDGDGLTDGDEVVTHHTNPLDNDTDDDGLGDGNEVTGETPGTIDILRGKVTDPLNPDTDGDGLTDGAEMLTHSTDPTNPDTDGDTLKDGAEVNTHHTNPLDVDTDDGTVNDGVEVTSNSTNPLVREDDVPKTIVMPEVGKAITLEGITFKTASAEILPESEEILTKALNTLKENPEVVVEIHGHTDNKGKHAYNLNLSKSRAESVRKWLTDHGIPAAQIAAAKGFSYDRPIATNDTDEGRAQNRRIEFYRAK